MLRFIEIDGLLLRKFVANLESTSVNTRHRRGSIAPAAREAGMEDDWLLPSSADAPRDDAPDPDPDLIRTLEANRAGWLSRRCKSAHWGIYRLDTAAESAATARNQSRRWSITGSGLENSSGRARTALSRDAEHATRKSPSRS